MYASLLLSICVLVGDGPTERAQAVNLYRLREAYGKATTQQQRDSIRQEVLIGIPSLKINQEFGQQQVDLWDACCSMWDVAEIPSGNTEMKGEQLPSLSMYKVNGVTFYRSDTAYNASMDTMYLTSSELPGLGGADVFFSPYHYYAVIRQYRWLSPYNYGAGINTPADEFGLRKNERGLTFYRMEHGSVRRYSATPRPVVRGVSIAHLCDQTSFVYMDAYDCAGASIGSFVFDHESWNPIPPATATLNFRCCNSAKPRTFIRCSVTVAQLALQDIDVRVHDCSAGGTTYKADGKHSFGFSIYEDLPSAQSAFSAVTSVLISGNTIPSHVRILQAKGHLDTEVKGLIAQLRGRGAVVVAEHTSEPRTLVEWKE